MMVNIKTGFDAIVVVLVFIFITNKKVQTAEHTGKCLCINFFC